MRVVNNPERCVDSSIQARDGSHVNRQTVEISERTLSVIAFGLAVAAFVTALWCMHDQEIHRQADAREIDRLVHEVNIRNVLIQDHDALLYRAGIKHAGDLAKGPTGNIEFNPQELQ